MSLAEGEAGQAELGGEAFSLDALDKFSRSSRTFRPCVATRGLSCLRSSMKRDLPR
ncbi:MAG: hypothetical protein OSA83_11250 [Pseudomonadales bacterium]|nr:hypothetical protein [Pseudomonadales bacterium]